MDEAELAQVLGEAFRLYCYELRQSAQLPSQFKPLLEGKHATVTIRLTKSNRIEFVAPQQTTITMSNFPDLPMVEPTEEKPKVKKKEKPTTVEDNYTERP